GCRGAKHYSTNHGWPIPGLRWVTGRECLSGLGLFPISTGGHGRCSSPERDAEEMAELSDDYNLVHFSDPESSGHRQKPHWGENGHDRKLQRYRTQRMMSHRDAAHDPECNSSSERLVCDRPRSTITHVPLRLQIKVNGQRGGLGICIAGGKGSVPYKENDEGIFISECRKVNGQDTQDFSHQDAVSVLRNAGSCIKMKVLRERSRTHEKSDSGQTEPEGSPEWDMAISSNRAPELCEASLEAGRGRIEATVCNGNAPNDPGQDFQLLKDSETFRNNALQVVKSTMTIPRIILTHPSTSDEDVEPLTQGPDETDFDSDFKAEECVLRWREIVWLHSTKTTEDRLQGNVPLRQTLRPSRLSLLNIFMLHQGARTLLMER
ncbi:hypothetical protein DNTS_033575, partial [Danionella cerebrum]